MQHVIKKQVIDLYVDKQLDSFRVQQQISDHFWEHLVPLLEIEFDKISGEDEVIILDQVEIDLGIIHEAVINKAGWNTDLMESLKKQLKEVILKETTGLTPASVKRSFTANSFKQWLFYMQNGYLPWNVSSGNEAWYDQVMEELATNYGSVAELRKEITDNPVMLSRMIRQHAPTFLISLLEVLTAEKHTNLLSAITRVFHKRSKDKILPPPVLYEEIWEVIFKASSSETDKTKPQELLKLVEEFPSTRLPSIEAKLAEEVNKARYDTPGLTEQAPTLKKHMELASQNKDILEQGIYVQHAGLVLIHPFLNSLFKQVALLSGKSFTSVETQEKAIYLLHYVATGHIKAEEHELVLPKILCGYPINLPVKTGVKLLAKHRKEADQMLKAAIASWDILKSTSADGLREGFLQRNGKVLSQNDQIKIQVEKGAIDVLLDHLPWNLSIIKLPWLEDVLKVEWR